MEKVVFGPSVEGLWRAMQPLTGAEAAAFLAAGVKNGQFAAAYPLAPYMKILEASAKSRFGHLQELDAYIAVGHLFVEGFGSTVIGQALMAIMKVVGPRRTLERMTRNFRSANNYTEATLQSLGPKHHLLKVNFVAQPGFYMGIIQRTVERAGAKGVLVSLADYVDQSPTFDISWQ